jgi:predicted Zn-dependent protease
MIAQLERLLANGQDTAMLRLGLGNAYLRAGDPQRAIAHLHAAVGHDPAYSAAWKVLGRALTEAGKIDEAIAAYEEGIRVAEQQGDMQVAKEMKVFLRRVRNRWDKSS